MNLSDLHGTPPPAVLAQRARVAALRNGTPPISSQPSVSRVSSGGASAIPPSAERPCAVQFDAPLDFVRLEFQAAEVAVEDTSITVLFRHDFRLHLGDLKPRLRLHIDGQPYDAAYLGGSFQIPSMGLRGMTFVRILPQE